MKKRRFKILSIIVVFLMILLVMVLYIPAFNHATYHFLVNWFTSDEITYIETEEVNINSDIILDTRSKKEYEISHLPNAIWVGEEYLPEDTIHFEPNKRIVVYCSIGWRSENYAKSLLAHQNLEVKNLYGGIFEWNNQQKILQNENGEKVTQVHPYSWFWGLWITNGEKRYN